MPPGDTVMVDPVCEAEKPEMVVVDVEEDKLPDVVLDVPAVTVTPPETDPLDPPEVMSNSSDWARIVSSSSGLLTRLTR